MTRHIHLTSIVAMLAVVLINARVAAAQGAAGDQNARLCGDANPEISIGGCNAVIQAGREKGKALAAAFASRGVAYMALEDFDRAIQDFAQSIKLDPTTPGCLPTAVPPTAHDRNGTMRSATSARL